MQFNAAKALLNGMAQMWYVWLILGLVLVGRFGILFLGTTEIGQVGDC